ncbi:cytochrome P450 monooxygenase [Armillaria luteobubalina]|uniref:Cytochrome P450 monooxygenase n=1 Tax=Armillaria luteobubalina TaxID=153913 RepID=A0AA39QGG4_9AGAR|nr:cytochrome P450 monooxygenase [Armillaria luteobubalina]
MFSLTFESLHTDLSTAIAAVTALVVLVHLVPYLIDSYRLRSYPGPLIAKFSDAWLAYVVHQGHRSEVIHDLHRKHGPFVRIAPNHVSVALSDAQPMVCGHGNGTLKSSFYDAFLTTSSSIFTVRDRPIHTRKRKIISHTFSQKSVLEFAPHVHRYVDQLLGQWDKLYDKAMRGTNYLTLDIIGDLSFGTPFGMIMAGTDSVLIAQDSHAVMESYGQAGAKNASKKIKVIKTLGGQSEKFVVTMGALPGWWRAVLQRTPMFWKGVEDLHATVGWAVTAISKRLQESTDRNDLLSKWQAGKDEDGNPMSHEELTAEAVTLLLAGSETTANSTIAIIYYIARTPSVQDKLHKELDEHLGSEVATAEQAVINEGLRLHSTVAMGLPRVAPEGGMTILGNYFPGVHRDLVVFGDDVEDFRPERWFECDSAGVSKAFSPFSVGPRACIGRNLANLELQVILASILKCYDFVLENPDEILPVKENFLRRPLRCRVVDEGPIVHDNCFSGSPSIQSGVTNLEVGRPYSIGVSEMCSVDSAVTPGHTMSFGRALEVYSGVVLKIIVPRRAMGLIPK